MGTYMITHKMLWLLQECRNVFYYVTTAGEPTNAEWQDIVDEIRGDVDAEIKADMSADWSWYGIDRRRVDTPGLLSFSEFPDSGAVTGTAGSDDLPTQVAMLISLKGDTVKPNRARSYLSGWTIGAVEDSLFKPAPLGVGETFIDLQSDLNAIGTNPLQRVAAQWDEGHTLVEDENDLSGAPAKGSQVPATQRRRRIGVGI